MATYRADLFGGGSGDALIRPQPPPATVRRTTSSVAGLDVSADPGHLRFRRAGPHPAGSQRGASVGDWGRWRVTIPTLAVARHVPPPTAQVRIFSTRQFELPTDRPRCRVERRSRTWREPGIRRSGRLPRVRFPVAARVRRLRHLHPRARAARAAGRVGAGEPFSTYLVAVRILRRRLHPLRACETRSPEQIDRRRPSTPHGDDTHGTFIPERVRIGFGLTCFRSDVAVLLAGGHERAVARFRVRGFYAYRPSPHRIERGRARFRASTSLILVRWL